MSTRCDYCGTESELAQAFRKVSLTISGSKFKWICPGCSRKRQNRFFKRSLTWCGVLAAAGVGLLFLEPVRGWGFVILNVLLFFVFCLLTILPHELGHAVAAHLVGFRVFRVVTGVGKPFYRRRFLSFSLEFRCLPLGGFTVATPKERGFSKIKWAFYVSAGLAVNLIIGVSAYALIPDRPSELMVGHFGVENPPGLLVFLGRSLIPFQLIFAANILVVLTNIRPREIDLGFGKIPNDGLALIRLPSLSPEKVSLLRAAYYIYESMECNEAGAGKKALAWCDAGLSRFPDHDHLLNLKGITCLHLGELREARECFQHVLANPKVEPGLRYMLLNNIAYADALSGDTALLGEADQYSQETFENCPWIPEFKGTRGTVLVELGQIEKGLLLLRETLGECETDQIKAINACHIALAETKLGNLQEACRYAGLARSLDPNCTLLERVANQTKQPC